MANQAPPQGCLPKSATIAALYFSPSDPPRSFAQLSAELPLTARQPARASETIKILVPVIHKISDHIREVFGHVAVVIQCGDVFSVSRKG